MLEALSPLTPLVNLPPPFSTLSLLSSVINYLLPLLSSLSLYSLSPSSLTLSLPPLSLLFSHMHSPQFFFPPFSSLCTNFLSQLSLLSLLSLSTPCVPLSTPLSPISLTHLPHNSRLSSSFFLSIHIYLQIYPPTSQHSFHNKGPAGVPIPF